MNGITERVERGAALLDDKRPGWWQQIDLDTLDVRAKCDCVLGQVAAAPGDFRYDRYVHGLDIVRLDGWQAPHYGFDYDVRINEEACCEENERAIIAAYAALTQAWRDLILARRAAASVAA